MSQPLSFEPPQAHTHPQSSTLLAPQVGPQKPSYLCMIQCTCVSSTDALSLARWIGRKTEEIAPQMIERKNADCIGRSGWKILILDYALTTHTKSLPKATLSVYSIKLACPIVGFANNKALA